MFRESLGRPKRRKNSSKVSYDFFLMGYQDFFFSGNRHWARYPSSVAKKKQARRREQSKSKNMELCFKCGQSGCSIRVCTKPKNYDHIEHSLNE